MDCVLSGQVETLTYYMSSSLHRHPFSPAPFLQTCQCRYQSDILLQDPSHAPPIHPPAVSYAEHLGQYLGRRILGISVKHLLENLYLPIFVVPGTPRTVLANTHCKISFLLGDFGDGFVDFGKAFFYAWL